MMKMRYIDQWLSGLGLEHIIPKLTEHGITTPKKLAQLNLRDMYEIVGIDDAEDRKKLFYLIQRLNTIFKKEKSAEDSEAPVDAAEPPEAPEPGAPPQALSRSGSAVQVSPLRARPGPSGASSSERARGTSGASVDSTGSDDDLVELRKQRKATTDHTNPTHASKLSEQGHSSSHGHLHGISHGHGHKGSVGAEHTDPLFRAPSPIAPPVESIGGDILGRAEQASASRLSTAYHPTSFSGAGHGGADVGIGSVTAKVLARRQQRLAEQQEAESSRPIQPDRPVSRRQSSQEMDVEDRYSKGRDAYTNSGAESPPPPAPPLSNSGNGSVEGRYGFDKGGEDPSASGAYHRGFNNEDRYDTMSSMDDDVFEEDYAPAGPAAPEVVDMAIRVVVRKRPISRSELAKGDNDVLDIEAGSVFVHEPKTKVDLTKVIETHVFQFDDAFGEEITNEEIYNRTVKHLMGVVFDLGKASCFAYGQTGSGKTFTMMGSNPAAPASVKTNAGLYVLAARDIFSHLKHPQYSDLLVYVSCFEIYGGKLFDLLNDRNVVKCLEDSKQKVQLPGLTEHRVMDADSLLQLMSQAHGLRSIGSTGANLESSRSHQVLQIVIRKPDPVQEVAKARRMGGVVTLKAPKKAEYGKLSFIDLAGSERGVDTTNNSKQTRLEGAEINTSLLALKEVIRSLERKHGHTPFRGSKLTQVLKDSFVGEKTRTCMVACVSPSHTNCEHTLNTLRYADRVKEHQLSSNPSNGGDSTAEGRRSPPPQMGFESYEAPVRQHRPSTAAPSGSELARASSVGQSRPSTAVGRGNTRSSSTHEDQDTRTQPPSWELDRIRREAEGRRRPGAQPVSNCDASNEGGQYPLRRPASAITTNDGNGRRESKIPSSPTFRNRQLGGQRSISPNQSQSSPERNRPTKENMVTSSPARVGNQSKQNSRDGREAWQQKQVEAQKRPEVAQATNPFARLQSHSSPDRSGHLPEIHHESPARRPSNENIAFQSPIRLPSSSPEKSFGENSDAEVNEELADYTSVSHQQDETELLHKTVDLLSAHKLAIAEMVEVMKDEMGLVQDMEASDDRDSERYAEVLHNILSVKSESINILQQQLQSFRDFRKN